jgi:hypothetical protein
VHLLRVALVVKGDFLALARELLQLAQHTRCSTDLRMGVAASVSAYTSCGLPSSSQTTPALVCGLQQLAQHAWLLTRPKEEYRSFCHLIHFVRVVLIVKNEFLAHELLQLAQHARWPKEGHRSFCWLAQHARPLNRPKEHRRFCWLTQYAQLLNTRKEEHCSFGWLARHAQLLSRPKKRHHSFC